MSKIWIQSTLAIAIFAIIIFFLSNRGSKIVVYKKIVAIIFSFFAISVVIFPDMTNNIAQFIGVYRGADLLFYIAIIFGGFHVASIHFRWRENDRRIIKLNREITILKAVLNDKDILKDGVNYGENKKGKK